MTEQINTAPKEIRKFGILFTCVFLVLAGFAAYKGNRAWPWLVGVSGVFLITGFFFHSILRPIYVGWMRFAFLLGWINTRLLLGIFFYLILTPGAVLMRLFGHDALHRKLDPKASTYWVKRPPAEFKPERYKQLF